MKLILISGLGLCLALPGVAGAQAYYGQQPYSQPGYTPCPPDTHGTPQGCICNEPATFYSPSAPYNAGNAGYYRPGDAVPGYGPGAQGYNVRLYSPGVRVSGRPVEVPSGNVYVQGSPVYVQAPPVRVASPQIYLQRPEVYVQPSQVTVEPPTVHIAGCAAGSECEMVGTSRQPGSQQ